MEGVHFRREWITPEEAGYRAAAAALSDLAAMAARPIGVLLSMAVDPRRGPGEILSFQEGAREACRREDVPIIGGDLARSPGPAVLSVEVVGHSENPVLRSGALEGDEIWVTGELGGAGGAVELWSRGETPPDELREAFARPRPRLAEASWLATRVPLHALIDLSDGLAGDAGHLAAASGVAVVLLEERIPVNAGVSAHPGLSARSEYGGLPLELALRGGEDYELCCAVPPGTLDDWVRPFQDSFGVSLTRIGVATKGRGVVLEGKGGNRRPVESGGFDHFSSEDVG
jgi:thiamine-monophosphate kinase